MPAYLHLLLEHLRKKSWREGPPNRPAKQSSWIATARSCGPRDDKAFIKFALVLLLTGLLTGTAQARLGETLSDLKKRYDSPAPQIRRDDSKATWLFDEGDNGQLAYTVTFNAKGRSIAEGMKPVKRARFIKETALDFIEVQLAPFRDSKTQRILKPGEKYQFAGQDFICGQQEYVVLDEPRGLLLIWNQGVEPSVMVVSPEMFQRGN